MTVCQVPCPNIPYFAHGSNELHYSSVISLAEGDVPKVREKLVKAIEEVREVVRPSNDETLFCYNLDLFKVTV